MSKEIYISSTPHETRLAIVENDELTEIYYERENEYTLAGSIYNGKVTRVLPGMQSSFVDIGLERDAFLYITDFMEEAGDSAEFDSADGGSRRGSRDDRSGSRGDAIGARSDSNGTREDRGPRDESSTARVEGTQDRLPPPSVEVHTDRGDREGGRRRRGNRDGRNPNREAIGSAGDHGGKRDQTADSRIQPVSPSVYPLESSFDTPPVVQSGYIEPGADTSSAELGEGAPGADGSRRWRGRRGRRRGRTSSQREESQALQQPETAPDAAAAHPSELLGRGYQADSTNAEEVEENFDTEYSESFDLDASAAASSVIPAISASNPPDRTQTAGQTAPPDDIRPRDRESRPDREDRESGDRGRRDRGSREARAPRAPRGFAPSRALYGVDSSSEADFDAQTDQIHGAPTPEPLILPGESLSKYRKGEDGQTLSTSAQSAVPTPPPSTEYTLQSAWDGSAVLPGETMRPRSAGSSDSASSDHRGEGRGSRDRGGRDDRRPRSDRGDGRRDQRPNYRDIRDDRSRSSSQVAPPTADPFRNQAVVPDQPVSPPQASAAHLPGPISEISHYTPEPAGTPEPAAQSSSAPEQQGEPAEYEPTEASASVRFDPATRSEFRQSAPAADPFESLAPEAEPEQASQHFDGKEPAPIEADLHSIAHTITPGPETSIAPLSLHASEEAAAPAHEFTSIDNTGEMLSEPPAPPQAEVAEPTSPLHHETAVIDHVTEPANWVEGPSALLQQQVPEESQKASQEESQKAGEEEIQGGNQEEDFNATTLHSSSIEEMDYEEEETLEGAADLGTMIRDMSIDQITRPGEDPEEEDDILEEEDAVDDHLNGSYSETEEEELEDEPRSFDESSISDEHDSAHSPSSEGRYAASEHVAETNSPANSSDARDPDRRSGRRDGTGRRDGRRGDRGRDRGGDRARSAGGSGDRSISRPGRRDGRHSAQTTNLPAISDLLKPGQEVLIQIAKEPMAKKGARITSHIALPGRFLVFMPTVHHTGVSRKIESDVERRRLKEILLSEKGAADGGFIVRTAASGASEEELRSDLRFLLNLWADIKQRSESSKSPALIYHDLNLVERILRDQVTDTFSAIWVDTETEYERVLRFLQRFQPSLIRRVKLYTKETPLFEQFGLTEEINKALRSKVWLKSGGSIVINQTEALVAIDINTGKYVGKTARLEDTIVKTNLDAIPEIVRQIRLRDLGGIIIIDFIDMDERKNRNRVMAALEDELKKDRAPSKVLQFNDFGLVAITRKRVKQSLERTLSTTCTICQGTGMTKSPVTVCNDIYIEMRKMQKHLDRGDIMLRVNPDVVKQLKATGTKWLQEMEEMAGKTILVKSDPSLHPEQFDIH